METRLNRAAKPDCQAFDEVKFRIEPRYKQSGMSGDEWRISVVMEFWRKGNLIHSEFAAFDMERAMAFAAWRYGQACDDMHGYFAGEGEYCDQEGCAEKATVAYRLKKQYCREGHASEPYRPTVRLFCDRHKKRGDCGLEDADSNYEPMPIAEALEKGRFS